MFTLKRNVLGRLKNCKFFVIVTSVV